MPDAVWKRHAVLRTHIDHSRIELLDSELFEASKALRLIIKSILRSHCNKYLERKDNQRLERVTMVSAIEAGFHHHHHRAESTPSDVQIKRIRLGQCPRCGIQTHKVTMLGFGSPKPLTSVPDILSGRCMRCYPISKEGKDNNSESASSTVPEDSDDDDDGSDRPRGMAQTYNPAPNSTVHLNGAIIAGTNLTVYGNGNTVSGTNNTVYGDRNVVSGVNACARGNGNTVSGVNARARGNRNTVFG